MVSKTMEKCEVCGEIIEDQHSHYLKEIAKIFIDKGYLVVTEGALANVKYSEGGWAAPDIYLIKDLELKRVIEVAGAQDDYQSLENKARRMIDAGLPKPIIIFEATRYFDKTMLEQNKKAYGNILGKEPASYKEIERHYAEIWKRKGIDVEFWSEDDLILFRKRK